MAANTFYPPRRTGLIFHLALLLVLSVLAAYSFDRVTNISVGRQYFFFIVFFLVVAALLPLFLYRLYVLLRSYYQVSPEGLLLRWGMRVEFIPLNEIIQVVPVIELPLGLPVPVSRLPGAVVGVRRSPTFGDLEFMATTASDDSLVLVQADNRSFVISPFALGEFLTAYQRVNEIGSLVKSQPQSIYPSTVFSNIWQVAWARNLLLVGLFASLGLAVWGGLILSNYPDISLFVSASGFLVREVTTSHLLFLLVVNVFFYALNAIAGIFFFRMEYTRPLAFLLLGGSLVTSLLVFFAVLRALP